MNSMCTVESYIPGRKGQQQTLGSSVLNVLPLLPKSWWRAQRSSQQRPCWVLSLKPGAHTWQSSQGSWQSGAAIRTQIWETARMTMKRWLSYMAHDQFWEELQERQSSQEQCLQGDPWRRAPTALCVDTPEGHTWEAGHFLRSSFDNTILPPIMLPTYTGWSVISLFSFLTMMFIDRGHSECSGHILCSSRLSLKTRAQFNFMRFNEIHFSGCCPWPDTGRNIKLVSQGYTGIELSSWAILPLTNLMCHFSVILGSKF